MTAPATRTDRLVSVDLLRGLIMVIMALDHVRDYFGAPGADPTDLATTTPALFFTRWVTHICAPVFFLLTGTGAYFTGKRRGPAGLTRYLLTRGAWLVVLELTLFRFAAQFNIDYKVTIAVVLWALGWSMIALAFLVRLPIKWIAAIGLTMIVGHDLLDGITPDRFGSWAWLWHFLHVPGLVFIAGDHFGIIAYPVIPWIGVTALGYVLGWALERPAAERQLLLRRIGATALIGFLFLRLLNGYGDPRPWDYQPSGIMTLVSFLNLSKYPPSLLFLLMTLGPAMFLLAWFDARERPGARPLLPFGRTPLFFFLLHFTLIHLLAVVASAVRFGTISGMFASPTPDKFPVTFPPGWDLGLPFVYLVWAFVILVTWPLCHWYAGVRGSGKYPILSYL